MLSGLGFRVWGLGLRVLGAESWRQVPPQRHVRHGFYVFISLIALQAGSTWRFRGWGFRV